MVESYNCLRLDNRYIFQIEVYKNNEGDNDNKNFFKINGDIIPFEKLKVGQLAELITHKGKFEHKDTFNLWKVDVDESEITTEEDIKKIVV